MGTGVKRWLKEKLIDAQRYTGMDNIYLAKGGFWTTLRFTIGIIAAIGTGIAFGNLLPKETYGIYNYLLSLAGSLGFLTLTGMGTSVIRAVALGRDSVVPYSIKLQLRYNLFTVVAIGGIAAYYAIKGNAIFAISLGLLAIAVPISAVYHTYESVFIGKKRFDLLSLVGGISSFVAAVITIIALFYTKNIITIISIYSLVNLVPNIIAYLYTKKFLTKGEPDQESISELKRTGFHITAVGIIGALAQYLDKIVLFQAAGPVSLAIYGFAIAGPERLKGLAKNWASISLPRLTEKNIGEIRSVFYRRIAFSLLVGVILALGYIILSPLLFNLLLPQYLEAVIYSQVYALGLIVVPASIFIGNVFYGQNMLRALYANGIISQALRILLFIILGWRWHIWGLVVASIASYIITAISNIIIWEIESRRLISSNKE
ncbi:hypothetical protein C4553_00175 [Candidatus Parcubacteria bacterium]|nr:MAG: hypothetical protein C4553_00175 [Candidatus Parcubacteria bacterium]